MNKFFSYIKNAATPLPIIILAVMSFGVSALLNSSIEEIVLKGLEATAICGVMYLVGFLVMSYWNGE